jgi:hypothetical protein
MSQKIKKFIKSTPFLFFLFKAIYFFIKQIKTFLEKLQKQKLNKKKYNSIANKIHLFKPGSAGDYKLIDQLTILSVNQTFPLIKNLIEFINGTVKIITCDEFCENISDFNIQYAEELKDRFNFYKSDKSSLHDYYKVYAAILLNRTEIKCLFEIGLGTNNEKIASNMSKFGTPGASLRAFRDFLPNALIYGADFDKNILFEEDRIKTFFVDQTDISTFEPLYTSINQPIDVIIDDGLHAPNANIASLLFALKKTSNQNECWIIIEDITEPAVDVWKVISSLLPRKFYHTYIIKSKSSYMFVCHKISNVIVKN